MRDGQASVELLAVLGIFLLVVLVFTLLSTGFLSDLSAQQDYNEARDSVQALAEAADYVYAQGGGATRVITISIPHSADLSPNRTFVGRTFSGPLLAFPYAEIGGGPNAISMRVRDTDVLAHAKAPVTGVFPSSPGKHQMYVISHGNFVLIGENPLRASPTSLFITIERNETKSASVVFDVLSDEVGVYVEGWGLSNPSVTLNPYAFVVYNKTPVSVQLNFTASNSSGGLYSSDLNVTVMELRDNASASSYALYFLNLTNLKIYSFQIPVTVEVLPG